MEIHGMHIDKQQLLTSLDSIKQLTEVAQDQIQFAQSQVPNDFDDLVQSIDECEIAINDSLDEINQLLYQVESTDEI
tara:strand:+ start:182 stop:412 length:231 start_codon:yes stop_codon:yes gene_type:complete